VIEDYDEYKRKKNNRALFISRVFYTIMSFLVLLGGITHSFLKGGNYIIEALVYISMFLLFIGAMWYIDNGNKK